MQACFIGHRKIEITEELVSLLKQTVKTLVEKGVDTFLFGSRSDFDSLSWQIVTQLKDEYPFIKRVYVRSGFQHIDKSYEDYLLESYEETYFSPKLERAGKYAYVERNCEMIDKSQYCVFYYDEKYLPPNKSGSNLFEKRRKSGTRVAVEYATKQKKKIVNLFIQQA